MEKTSLTQLLNIKYPIIMAPMFLVSTIEMVIEATKNGITGAIPALNFRTLKELENAIHELKIHADDTFFYLAGGGVL